MKSPDRGFIIEALLTVEREKLTGILEVRAEGVRTRIFAYEGIPVFAEEGAVGEALGRVLVRRGLLTEDQFAFCIEQMSDALLGNEKKRFGDIVVECDFLTREQVDGALHDQVKQKIIGCIYRATGEWSFEAGREALEKVGHFQSPIRPVILEATRLFSQRRMEETLRLFEETYPVVKGVAATVGKEFRLSKAERQFVASLDGRRSTHAILASTIPEVDPSAVLAALTLVGSVDLSPTPAKAGSVSQVIDETEDLSASLFDDDEGGGWEEPKPASQPGERDEGKATAKLALARMMASRTARKKEPNTKEPTTEQERRIFAEEAFQQGKAKLRANDPVQALAHLKRAVELRPDAQEYKLYEVWAETRTNGQRPDKKEINEIKRLAVRLLKEDAACAFGYYVLAQLALVEEKDDIALKLFQKAATIDPSDLDAARYARFIERRSSRGQPAGPHALEPAPAPARPPPKAATMMMPMVPNYPAPTIQDTPSQKIGTHGTQLEDIVTNVLRARGPTASDPPRSLDVPRVPSMPPGAMMQDDDDDLSLDPFFQGGAPRGIVGESLPPGSSLMPPPEQKSSGGVIAFLTILLIASATAGYGLFRYRENHREPVVLFSDAGASVADAAESVPVEGGIVVIPVIPPSASAVASATPSASAVASAVPSAVPSASSSASSTSAVAGSGTTGELTVGASAKGHRIFFDGRVLGETGTYTVPCGSHKVKVGSGGKEQVVSIPCGSNLSLP